MEYKIVFGEDRMTLERRVNSIMELGFQPLGGVCGWKGHLSQAVLKNNPDCKHLKTCNWVQVKSKTCIGTNCEDYDKGIID